MAKGISLHLGLNSVNPSHYAGWAGPLTACEFDAKDMASLAKDNGFQVKTLLTKNATRKNLLAAFAKAVSSLSKGDIFFLTYSGHGGQVNDLNNDEADGLDETWCLYDGEFIDDELYFELSKFKEGVRVIILSDSCHSGTVTKAAFYSGVTGYSFRESDSPPKFRAMPDVVAERTYRKNKKFYDAILKNKKLKNAQEKVMASVILISGCQDNQLSMDGDFNGLFTGKLLSVWKNGIFAGDYLTFYKKILGKMPPDQTPNFFETGKPNPAFKNQRPFKV